MWIFIWCISNAIYRLQMVFHIATLYNNDQALQLNGVNGKRLYLLVVVNSLLGTMMSKHVFHSVDFVEFNGNVDFKRGFAFSGGAFKMIPFEINRAHQIILIFSTIVTILLSSPLLLILLVLWGTPIYFHHVIFYYKHICLGHKNKEKNRKNCQNISGIAKFSKSS